MATPAGLPTFSRESIAGTVLLLSSAGATRTAGHVAASHAELAGRIAGLLGFRFGGEYRAAAPAPGTRYFVPAETLLAGHASELGISDEDDLFGGVVPHAFVATKAISHPVLGLEACAPDGWSHGISDALGDAVLEGYSAFSPEDARRAGRKLLEHGEVRMKPGNGIGGSGQSTVASADQLDAVLADMPATDLLDHGVVLERNLSDAVTYSIGRLRLGGWTLAYHGTQWMTTDHGGQQVYGGSELLVTRGGFGALSGMPMSPEQHAAVEHVIRYDQAVARAYPGFFASRRNYDVAAGCDADGVRRCGVLEQSWRIGGASPAELAAVAAFRADPSLQQVRVSCHEVYSDEPPPPGAMVHFRGLDPEVGMLCKYSLIEEPARP